MGEMSVIKGYVMKINPNLTPAWTHMYGFEQDASSTSLGRTNDIMDITPCSGGYFIVGYENVGSEIALLVKTDMNGNVVNGWPKTISGADKLISVKRTIENGAEYFYVFGLKRAGNEYSAVVKIDTNGNVIWETPLNPGGSNWAQNMDVSTSGDIFVSLIAEGPLGKIYKLNKTTGAVMKSFAETDINLKAQELHYKIKATTDGGCVVASTVLRYPITACGMTLPQGAVYDATNTPECNEWLPFDRWNTDAYVAKFSSSLYKLWSTAFDAPTTTPGGTALNILSNCSDCADSNCPISTWEIPNQQGLDVTRQECIFDIEETPDGGFIIAGKNSLNLDDCYTVKLCGAGSSNVIDGEIIADTRGYKHYSLNTLNSNFTNTSNTRMEACSFILFQEQTEVAFEATLSADISTVGCCDALYGAGLRAGLDTPLEYYKTEYEETWHPDTKLYPNPNHGRFTFGIKVKEPEILNIEVYSPIGTMIYYRPGIEASGNYTTDIDLSSYQLHGLFLLKVYTKKKVYTHKFIKH
jgi:hypothetical protein